MYLFINYDFVVRSRFFLVFFFWMTSQSVHGRTMADKEQQQQQQQQ